MDHADIIQKRYSLHGIEILCQTGNRHIGDAVDLLLEHFATHDAGRVDISISLNCGANDDAQVMVPETARLMYTPSESDMFDVRSFRVETLKLYLDAPASTYYIDYGQSGRICCSLRDCRAWGFLTDPDSMPLGVISSNILFFILNKLLQSRGYFSIHSSSLEKDGKGVVIPGFSGAGKTTTCIALTRQGFGFLGDDRSILVRRGDGLELLGFPEPVDVTDNTIRLFPELASYDGFRTDQNLRKKSFRVEDIYPNAISESCVPAAILFPQVIDSEECHIEPVARDEAVTSFLPHSMLVMDKETARRHFNILCDLVVSTDCYSLKLGRNLENIDAIVASIL